MTIGLPASLEKELEHLAVTQGRDLGELVEEAVRQDIEALANDLDLSIREPLVKCPS